MHIWADAYISALYKQETSKAQWLVSRAGSILFFILFCTVRYLRFNHGTFHTSFRRGRGEQDIQTGSGFCADIASPGSKDILKGHFESQTAGTAKERKGLGEEVIFGDLALRALSLPSSQFQVFLPWLPAIAPPETVPSPGDLSEAASHHCQSSGGEKRPIDQTRLL